MRIEMLVRYDVYPLCKISAGSQPMKFAKLRVTNRSTPTQFDMDSKRRCAIPLVGENYATAVRSYARTFLLRFKRFFSL